MKTFTIRQAALWSVLSFSTVMIVAFLFIGGVVSLFGLSLALNLYLAWHHIGHARMMAALGLDNPESNYLLDNSQSQEKV